MHIFSRFASNPDLCSVVEDPQTDLKIVDDLPLTLDGYVSDEVTSGSSSSGSRYVQIRPQRVKLKVRVNQETSFKFKVAQSTQYPVDLYYLMDMSNSMSDDRENIVSKHK